MELSIDQARTLIEKHLQDPNNRIHSRESEVVLRAIAKELNEDEDLYGMAGYLHDLDWEKTAETPEKHGLITPEILKEEGYEIPEESIHAIAAHNEQYTGVKRENNLDYAVAAGESITGLIYSYALMRPEHIEGMKPKSLNKKFKDKNFAAKVSRELIADIEKTGIEKSRFFEIAIQAMKEISSEIGF